MENESSGLDDQFEVIVRAKKEWESAIDAVTDLVFLTDQAGTVLRCNVAAQTALGRSFGRVLGRSLVALLRSLFRSEDLSLLSESGELEVPRDKRILQYSRFPAACDGQSLGFVFVFRDVTELRRLQIVASRVDMMNNLGQVLACVRHEIGNPTNAMKTALTVMSESLQVFSTEKMKTYVERCLDDVQRIQDLLERLRTFSMFDVSVRERVDLRALLKSEIPGIRDGLKKQRIVLACTDFTNGEPAVANCDPRALYQILLGLIANASESLANCKSPGRIHLSLYKREGEICLSVADNGTGIEPRILDKVVLPLFTTKRGGTGLGLAIAHEMLTRMKGSLEIGNDATLGGARLVIHLRETPGSRKDSREPSPG